MQCSLSIWPKPQWDPSRGSPGTWPHPQCGTSSLDSLSGCQPGVWEVPGPWFARPLSPASHMALWSAPCPRESKEKMSSCLKNGFFSTSYNKACHISFKAQLSGLTVLLFQMSWGKAHTPHWSEWSLGDLWESSHLFVGVCSFEQPHKHILWRRDLGLLRTKLYI